MDSDTRKVKKNVIRTGMNTKESLITNYFKPIDKAKHQQQNQRILRIFQLEAKCNKLEKEKWELTKQLAQLRWIENTEIKTSEHGNKWKTSGKGTTKTKRSKKKQKKKQTLTAQRLPCHETDQPAQQQQQQQQCKQDQSHPDRERQLQHQQQEHKHGPNYCGVEKREQVDNKGQQQKSTVIIAGDSIVKNLNGWMMSRAKRSKVHSFSGATTTEMKHFIKPLVQRKPSEIILHVGTNDVDIHSAEEVADNIIKLTDDTKKKGIRCTVSSLVVRADSELLKSAVIDVNNVLRDSLPQDVNFVEHSNITNYHLNNSRLHLNHRGDTALVHNFIQHIRSSNCGKEVVPVLSDNEPAVVTSDSFNCSIQINPGFVDSALTDGGSNSSETDNSAIITARENELLPKNKLKGLKLVSLNIASLLKHLDELRIFVEEEKPHIIGINETRLDNMINDSDIEIDGFEVMRWDRDRNGGGVALYVHKSLDVTIRQDLMDCNVESVSVQIKVGHYRPFIVTSLYRPPGKPVSHFKDIEKTLSAIEADGKEAIIMGDTNCDYLNQSNNDTKHMKKIAHKLGFSHIIKEATRTTADTKTNIDHIFTNKPEFVRTSGVIHCGISDHDAAYMIRNMRVSKPHKLPPKILNVRNFRKFVQVAFQLDIEKIPTEQITFVSKDINEMWLLWKTFFLDILNKQALITNIKVKSNHLPYVTSELRGLIRQGLSQSKGK